MHDADATALNDSVSFRAKVDALDADAADYRVQVADLVKAEVDAGRFNAPAAAPAAPPAPAASGTGTTASKPGKAVEDMSIDELIAAGYTGRR